MKKCAACKNLKPESEFHKNSSRKDGLQHSCKACKSIRDSNDYKVNNRKDEVKFRREAQRTLNRQYIKDYLIDNGTCVDCGTSDKRVLEFDHVRGIKRNNISSMVNGAYSLESLKIEIQKCEVRCANCHRIRTRETLWGVEELVDSLGSDPRRFVGSKPTAPA